MVRINQLVRRRRYVGEDAEPSERVDPFECLHGRRRHAAPAYAVITVATDDVVADEFVGAAPTSVADRGMIAVKTRDADVARLEDGGAPGRRARVHEVLGHFGLSVNRHPIARKTLEVDAKRAAGESQREPVVHQSLALQTLVDLGRGKQINGALLEDSGADPPLDVAARLAFEHHAVDAVKMQELGKQKPGGSGADDCHLSTSHDGILKMCSAA
jgi:hypothetical protein